MRTSLLLAVLAVLASACGGGDPAAGGSPSPPSPTASAAPAGTPSADEPATSTPTPTEPTPAATTASPERTEVRGVWIQLFDDTLKTPEGIDAALDRAAAANANTVIAEVVRRQDAYYDSDVLPRSPDPALADGFDPLARLVEGAHARGLQLHAWVPLMPTYHHVYDDLPRPDGWVHAAHGLEAPEDQRWVTRYADGRWDDHLDPALPEVRDHVVAVLTELAARYDVDAVHLDYLRYTDQRAGYHPRALARFQSETGRTDVPAPTDAQWSDWRRAQTRSLLERIRTEVAAADAGVGISAAVIAQGEGPHPGHPYESTRGYEEYFQDWAGWVRDGLLDAAYPMDYFDARTHQAWFEQWAAFAGAVAQEVEPEIAVGQGSWLNRPDDSLAQLQLGQQQTDGTVVYSFQQTADEQPYDVLLERLPQTLWAEPAAAPALR